MRDEIEDDLERIRQLKDDVDAGSYDRNFRGEAKRAVAAIDKRIDELEDKIDDKVRDASDLNKKVATISGQQVLKNNTNLDKRNTGIGRLQNEIKRLKDDKQDILSDNVSRSRGGYTSFLRYADFPFTGIDGNRYGSGGIRSMKRRLARLKGQTTTDQIGVKAVRDYLKDLIRDKEEALNLAKSVSKDWEDLAGAGDDDFFTKCLVKIESAAYQTVTACDYVRFAIRCKLFRRVSGRAKDYGQNEAPDGFKLSDNCLQGRMAFFKVSYKQTNSAGAYSTAPIVFAVRRTADKDNFIGLAFKGPTRAKWEFKIDPIGDIGAEVRESGQNKFAFI